MSAENRPYHLPPDDYEPPTHCSTCAARIIYTVVVDGECWAHLTRVDPAHVVTLDQRWWDVTIGQWREADDIGVTPRG